MNLQKKHNGLGAVVIGSKIYLFYKDYPGRQEEIRIAQSSNGETFRPARQKLQLKGFLGFKKALEVPGNLTISKIGNEYLLLHKDEEGAELAGYLSADGFVWNKIGTIGAIRERALVVKQKNPQFPFLMFFGEKNIKIAQSADLVNWQIKRSSFLKPRKNYFDDYKVEIGNVFLLKEGILILYVAQNRKKNWSLGGALYDKNDYRKLIWRSSYPFWQQPKGSKSKNFNYIGSAYKQSKVWVYWELEDGVHFMALPQDWLATKKTKRKSHKEIGDKDFKLQKFHQNPIIKPIAHHDWESNETFNPGAIHLDDKVHLVYRAVGSNGMSVFGYASSKDGFSIDERLDDPIFYPSQPFEYNSQGKPKYSYPYMSGGGWGGCEDPRLTKIEDRIFMTYTAFNGWQAPGVALTSISVDDFLNKNWQWERPILLSKPGSIQKNWVLFPEKINGKFAILHSINPRISIEYFDDLKLAETAIDSYYDNKGDENRWDNIVRGAAAPPIKTENGWLLFYHAMDKNDPKHYWSGYWSKVGAMLLDLNDPTRVLFRSHKPLLEADQHYEQAGSKAGVVYVCGSVIKDDNLFVYYGGADCVSCVATAPMKKFIDSLVNYSKVFEFKKMAIS